MITPPNETAPERHLRRKDAAKYVVETYNVPCSPKTLAKLACVSSNGPPFRLAGRFPLYPIIGSRCLGALQNWALGPVNVRSPHRRLIPEKRNPAARFPWRDRRAHRALRSPELENPYQAPPKTQSVSHLPLFSWRVAVVQSPPPAPAFICRASTASAQLSLT